MPQISQSQSTSAPSFLMDPAAGSQSYGDILSQLEGRLPGAPPDYASLLSQGVSSPLMSTVLDPIMGRLRQQFSLQNQQLQDEFRGAGALGSGAQGSAMANLMGQQGLAAGSALAGGVGQLLPMILSGLQRQYQDQMAVPGLLGSILGQTRPLVGTGGRQSTASSYPGGSTGGAGGSDSTDAIFNEAVRRSQAGYYGGGSTDDYGNFDLSGMGGSYDPYATLASYNAPGIGGSYNPSPTMPGIFSSYPQATSMNYPAGDYTFASGLPPPSTGQTPIDTYSGYTGSEAQPQQDTSNLYADYY